MEESKVDFSRCVFFLNKANGTTEAPGREEEDGQASILPLKSIVIVGTCADLRDFVFPCTASFDCTTFKGDARFDSATLENAGFGSATFQGFVSFSSPIFRGAVSFSKTTFKGHAGSHAATFQGDPTLQPDDLVNDIFGAWFDSATFEGDAWFDSAKFLRDAKFQSATFLDRASFANATFGGRALFRAQTFPKDVFFDNARFGPERADFSLATFERVATFGKAEFRGEADFNAVAGKRAFSMAGAQFRARPGLHRGPFRRSTAARQSKSDRTDYSRPPAAKACRNQFLVADGLALVPPYGGPHTDMANTRGCRGSPKSLSEIILFCGKAFLALAGLKPSAGTRGLSGSGIPNPWPACGSG